MNNRNELAITSCFLLMLCARSRAVEWVRQPASNSPAKGKHHVVTHLYDWRHRLHLQATPPSALTSPGARAALLPGNPCLALGSGLALHPARSSDAGVTLVRWVSICYGGGGRRRGKGWWRRRSSPCEHRNPLLCIPAERTGTHRPQLSPGPWDTCCGKSQSKDWIKKKVSPCSFSTIFPFIVVLSIRRSGCGMVHVSSESCLNCERRRFMSAF